MTEPMLPPMLAVADVQARYRLRDPRAARRLIREAGGIRVAGRWMVRADLLDAWECGQGRINTDPHAACPTGSALLAMGNGSTMPPHRRLPPLERGWLDQEATE